ncbi:MAG TPA: hypothetical protein VF173_06220 [Thermoanaerobaculia bacterium]|nr:hypothetical protein [Thermoanaerobaculia bacterium]
MPAEEVYVFDACAVVALLQAEPGASVVSSLLEENHRCLVHAIDCQRPAGDAVSVETAQTTHDTLTQAMMAGRLRIGDNDGRNHNAGRHENWPPIRVCRVVGFAWKSGS